MDIKVIEGATSIDQFKTLLPLAFKAKEVSEEEFISRVTTIGKQLDDKFDRQQVLSIVGCEPSDSEKTSINDLFADLALNDADVQAMEESVFIVPDLIVKGHLIALIAEANGGKTALMVHQSAKLAQAGYDVLYINVDASPGDLKRHYEHAKTNAYKVIAPDAKIGKNVQDAIDRLITAADKGIDLSNTVIILDTLKKFTEVIQKSQAKEFYTLMRKLTVCGATIIMLGHANKYRGEDGKMIYEGTADLRNDVDDLIYLNSVKNEETNRREITTYPDKVRAEFQPRSFFINLYDRSVEEPNEVVQILDRECQQVLRYAKEAIASGVTNQGEIISYIKERVDGIGKAKLTRLLTEFTTGLDPKLRTIRGGKNAVIYSVVPPAAEMLKDLMANWGSEKAVP